MLAIGNTKQHLKMEDIKAKAIAERYFLVGQKTGLTAESLGINRSTVFKTLLKLGIKTRKTRVANG